jgi:CHAT domain-containing protein/tetratricopeptide (TPR) repeat protein
MTLVYLSSGISQVARYLAAAVLIILAAPSAEGQVAVPSPDALASRIVAASERERAELLSRSELATLELARALIARGAKERAASELARALTAYDAAEKIARRLRADRELGLALNGVADALFRQADRRGLAVAQESIALHERLNDISGQAEAWNTAGNVKSYGGLAALPEYEKSLELWTAANDRVGMARALNNIGNIYRGTDDDKAFDHLTRALRMLEELGDQRRAGVVIGTIAIMHFNRGEYPEALEYARRALAIQEKSGDRLLHARALDHLGNIFVAQGAYGRALDHFHRSLKMRLAAGARFDAAESWNNIGMAYAGQGDYELALAAYREALRLNKAIDERPLVAEALINMGSAAAALGQLVRAEANYRESLKVSEAGGDRDRVRQAAALQGLADIVRTQGRTKEAEAHLARALALHDALKNRRGTAEALSTLAAIDLDARRPERALARGKQVAEIAHEIDAQELIWQAHTLMGRAYRQIGQRDAARTELTAAIEAIDRLRQDLLPGRTGRAGFLEARLAPFHELLALSIEEGASASALELAERAKARVLADILQHGQADITALMTDAERREERRLQSGLLSLNQRIQSELLQARPDRSRIDRLEKERAERRLEYEAFEARLYSSHPDLQVQRGAATPFTLAETPQVLAVSSMAVLQYVVADERAYLFVLTRTAAGPALETFTLPTSARALARSAREFRERIAARDLSVTQDARRLYDILIAPAAGPVAGKSHVIVVPDGPLWNVPFQALRDDRQRYWIESTAISYAPSLTVLRETLRKPAAPAGKRTLFAMGKAEFGSRAAKPAVPLMSDLGPLPDAERQVRLIGGFYGAERSRTYLGAEAREDRFKAEAARFSILHLASHGVLDEASPFYSHIVLSPGSGGSSEDGLLEAWELLGLKLNAELVILSACETGRGRIAAGEGTVGTMWALFVAGSRGTLVSQWRVEARSTTALMTAFHAGLAAGEGTKAELLRQASLSVLKDPNYAHPFYWAPFALVGHPY